MHSPDRYNTLKLILWSVIMALIGSVITKALDNRMEREEVLATGHGWDKVKLVLEQIIRRNMKRVADVDKDRQAGHLCAALDLPQIGGIDVAQLRQFVRRQAARLPNLVDPLSQFALFHSLYLSVSSWRLFCSLKGYIILAEENRF